MDVNIIREIGAPVQRIERPAVERPRIEAPNVNVALAPELPARGAQAESVTISAENAVEMLNPIMEYANARLQPIDRLLQASIHEGTNRLSVRVIDRNTDEVVREIPSEKILDLLANIQELAGLMVDARN